MEPPRQLLSRPLLVGAGVAPAVFVVVNPLLTGGGGGGQASEVARLAQFVPGQGPGEQGGEGLEVVVVGGGEAAEEEGVVDGDLGCVGCGGRCKSVCGCFFGGVVGVAGGYE